MDANKRRSKSNNMLDDEATKTAVEHTRALYVATRVEPFLSIPEPRFVVYCSRKRMGALCLLTPRTVRPQATKQNGCQQRGEPTGGEPDLGARVQSSRTTERERVGKDSPSEIPSGPGRAAFQDKATILICT
eukprot:153497-Pyramimonas_sp.AAC.1